MAGMEYACECDYEYEHLPVFFREEEHTARKAYKCCECRHAIKPGDKYVYTSGKWDGDFDTFKTCLPCSRIRRDFCGTYGGLRLHIIECLGIDIVTGKIVDDDGE